MKVDVNTTSQIHTSRENNDFDTNNNQHKNDWHMRRQENAINYWQEHGKLMWSRLQTIAVLEAGIITGWHSVFNIELLGIPVLIVGSILLIILGLLIHRDSRYMYAYEKAAGDYFIHAASSKLNINGRRLAYAIITILILSNIYLICYTAGNNAGIL